MDNARSVAQSLRTAGDPLGAALTLISASPRPPAEPEPANEDILASEGLTDLHAAARAHPHGAYGLAARDLLISIIGGRTSGTDDAARSARAHKDTTQLEQIEHLFAAAAGDPANADGYLVRGLWVDGRLAGHVQASVPDYMLHTHMTSWFPPRYRLGLRSALHCAVRAGDYHSVLRVVRDRPESLSFPVVEGWRCVAEAATGAPNSDAWFDRAADAFATDAPPDPKTAKPGQSWTSYHRDLLAPFFRARARLVRAVADPAHAKALVLEAHSILAPARGWADPAAARLRMFLHSLAALLDPAQATPTEADLDWFAIERFVVGPEDGDALLFEFALRVGAVRRALETDAALAVTTGALAGVLDVLARLPHGDNLADPLARSIGAAALEVAAGVDRSWVHRELQAITDERHLHRVLLRLFQNSLPSLAQVRHGPLEYGKDIAVIDGEGSSSVVRMYQAKCGQITKRSWPGIKTQLEEIFQLPLSGPLAPSVGARRVGVLVWNGHFDPHVEPLVSAWLKEQTELHKRQFELWHLDVLAAYIVERRLFTTLRAALGETGRDQGAG